MEPELEFRYGVLGWTERLALARELERWARQLRVTARMLEPKPRGGPPRLKRLPVETLRKN